jgi:hypothetical protein
MKTLRFSSDLELPLDVATQTLAIIARKGAGKTYAAGKLTELLHNAGVQTVVLDPVGNWYGLRLAADGKGKGLDIPVLGGLRGDLPLLATGGELVADAVVESGRSMILDVSQFSLGERKRFATAFGERLWKKKKGESHPSPLFLVIEEAQLIVPQHVSSGDTARMVGIFEEIIRLGRNYGIGCAMITQRPQSVNKEVLNQTECLVVLQVNGAQERKALGAWIVHQGMDPALLDELPSLPIGTAYVWSPQWLGILKRVKIAPKVTFDASATPRVGSKTVRRELAPLDLGELEKQMAATIETAKANDPRELRKQIDVLKKQLVEVAADLGRAQQGVRVQTKRVEVPVLKDGQLTRLEKLAAKLAELTGDLAVAAQPVRDGLAKLQSNAANSKLHKLHNFPDSRSEVITVSREQVQPLRGVQRRAGGDTVHNGSIPTGGMRRMMIALAQRPQGLSTRQIGVRAGMSSSSGTFGTYLGKMRSHGWCEGARNSITITPAGVEALGAYQPLPTGTGLLNHWLAELGPGSGAARMLQALVNSWPGDLSKEELGKAAEISHTSGTFGTYLGRLRALELIENSGSGRELRASPEFFMEETS